MDNSKLIFSKILQIETEIKKKTFSERNGLLNGNAGHALFYFNLYTLTKKKEHYNMGVDLLEHIASNIGNEYDFSFAGGLSGIGWLFEYLSATDVIEIDSKSLLRPLRSIVYKHMRHEMSIGNFDFLYGAVGAGVFFLQSRITLKNRQILTELLKSLESSAISDINGIRWKKFDPQTRKTVDKVDVGLAHGIGNILYFVIACYKKSVQKKLSLRIMRGIIKYLAYIEQDVSKYHSFYPSIIDNDLQRQYSRLGWCYGDLSIIAPLALANQVLADPILEEKIAYMLDVTVERKDYKHNSIYDAGLCHGTAGLSVIYKSLFSLYPKSNILSTSNFWLECTLKMDAVVGDLTGFKPYYPEEIDLQDSFDGVLEGTAGIGLMFISSISKKPLEWEKILLLQ